MTDPSERFAAELRGAEERLRLAGLGGRRAFVALVRHLCARLELARDLWPDGPDAPAAARLDTLTLSPHLDLFGLAYERFFTDLFKGSRGQYFTPRPLVELVADLAEVRPGESVLDPTCGSGGFLVAALARGADVDGVEVDPDLALLARLNLALHGGNPRGVVVGDFFRAPPAGEWDVVLANPPFSLEIDDPAVLAGYTLGEGRRSVASDALFLEAALRRLRPGGRLVTVLPWSMLTGPASAPIRAWVDGVAQREAVVSLPEGAFRPFGGTPTRACVLALRRRPARVRPMLAAVVTHPGYDPRRQTFRHTEPDELGALRLHLRGGPYAAATRLDTPTWVPEEALASTGVAPGVPTFTVAERAPLVRARGALDPDAACTVIDFADVDKGSGEVVGARVARAGDVSGGPLDEGDLLFGRMRPELNNVVRAERPRDGLPATLAGSGEWVRLRAEAEPWFVLLALRSPFARRQLQVTGGQTRPRAHADDIAALRLPDPGPSARAALDETLGRVRTERARLRRILDEIDALYAAFGAGEIDAAALETRVRALSAAGPSPAAPRP